MRLWTLLHTKGWSPCGKPAIKTIRKPLASDRVTPEIMRNIDGSVPSPNDLVLCQSCGGEIWPFDVDDFTEDES